MFWGAQESFLDDAFFNVYNVYRMCSGMRVYKVYR